MWHKLREGGLSLDGKSISGGVARVRYTYDTRQSINKHLKLLMEIKAQTKVKLKAHKDNVGLRYIEPGGAVGAPKADRHKQSAKTKRQQGCRHHVRPRKAATPTTPSQATTDAEEGGYDTE